MTLLCTIEPKTPTRVRVRHRAGVTRSEAASHFDIVILMKNANHSDEDNLGSRVSRNVLVAHTEYANHKRRAHRDAPVYLPGKDTQIIRVNHSLLDNHRHQVHQCPLVARRLGVNHCRAVTQSTLVNQTIKDVQSAEANHK